jgi:ABC-2 type transport system ATP-binding protein
MVAPSAAMGAPCGSAIPDPYSTLGTATASDFTVTSPTSPVATIHATLTLPAGASAAHRVPVVLQTHGGGQDRHAMHQVAEHEAIYDGLVQLGYAVITWDTRGNGQSVDPVFPYRVNPVRYYINDPDYEVRDVQALLDYAAQCDELQQDAPGDPRAGMAGVSNAANIQLAAAAHDPTGRIDAIAAQWTNGEIDQDFVPNNVAKRWWRILYEHWGYTTGTENGTVAAAEEFHTINAEIGAPAATQAARPTPGALSATSRSFFAGESLVTDAADIHTPTLIVQGLADTGTPPEAAFSLVREISNQSQPPPIRLVMTCGGHGGCPFFGTAPTSSDTSFDRDPTKTITSILAWLDEYVRGNSSPINDTAFEWQDQMGLFHTASLSLVTNQQVTQAGWDFPTTYQDLIYPSAQTVTGGDVGGTTTSAPVPRAGRAPKAERDANWAKSPPLITHPATATTCLPILGRPTVRLRGSVPAAGTDAWIFLQLIDVGPGSYNAVLGDQATAWVLSPGAFDITVPMPGVAWVLPPGHTLGAEITSGSSMFMAPSRPAHSVQIQRIDADIPLASPMTAVQNPSTPSQYTCPG